MSATARLLRPVSQAAALQPDPSEVLLLLDGASYSAQEDLSIYSRPIGWHYGLPPQGTSVVKASVSGPGGQTVWAMNACYEPEYASIIAYIGANGSDRPFPDFSTFDHTIEFWYKPDGSPESPPSGSILHGHTGEAWTYGLHVSTSTDGRVNFDDGHMAGASTAPLAIFPNGISEWIYIACVQHGSCKKIYINGVLMGTATQNAKPGWAPGGGGYGIVIGDYGLYSDVDGAFDSTGGNTSWNNSGLNYRIAGLRIVSRALYVGATHTLPPFPMTTTNYPTNPGTTTGNCFVPAGVIASAPYCLSGDLYAEFHNGSGGTNIILIEASAPECAY